VTTLVFALVFGLTSQFEWRHVWFGAIVTAVLYAIGKALFGLYVEWSGVKSGYGAAGALVVFLVWVYYTAQIILFGAEAVAASAIDREKARAAQLTGRLRGV
jgi:membrane protein